MLKIPILIISIAICGFVLIEAFQLIELKLSIGRYAHYWKQYPADGTFTYVAMGDSAAQGIGASKPEFGYVGLLAKHIQQTTGQKVRIINLSVSGATVEDVLNYQVPMLKNYHPNLITVDAGSNDVAHNNIQTFAAHYDVLAQALPQGTIVSNIPYFGGRIHNNTQALQANTAISTAASTHHLVLVDIQTITKERQSIFNYAADYFHPNDRGYRNWDAAFWPIVEPLVKK